MSSKHASSDMILLLALLLFSSLTYNVSGRRLPLEASPDRSTVVKSQSTKLHQDIGGEKVVNVENECQRIGEDECLMKRSLNAHLDYIYTQDNKKQP